MHGPPPYFTPDWPSSAASVKTLAELKPAILATRHGKTFYGTRGLQSLEKLARQFNALAVPEHGRYVPDALADENGVYYVPPGRAAEEVVCAGGPGYWERFLWSLPALRRASDCETVLMRPPAFRWASFHAWCPASHSPYPRSGAKPEGSAEPGMQA